jgi:hypothetical protein
LTPLRREFVTALTAALFLVASPHRAGGATDTVVRLQYQADAQSGCVGEGDLRRMVTEQLGHDPFRPDADQRVAISIDRTDAGFHARIVWTEADGRQVGERVLSSRSRDCHEIAANVAFAVALQLQLLDRGAPNGAGDADAGADAEPPKPPEETERPVVKPEAPPVSPNPAQPGPVEPTRLSLAVGAGPAVGIGMAPEPNAVGRLFVIAGGRRFSAELAGDAALAATLRESDGSGIVVNTMGASAAGCGHMSVVSACLLGRLGWIRASGMGITMPKTSWGRFSEVGLRLAATRELGRFMASVHADGLVMVAPWNVVFKDAVVWKVPRVGGMVGLDLAVRFF